jgi:hypothetical protein
MEMAGSLSPSGLKRGVFVKVRLPGIVAAPARSAATNTSSRAY